MSLHRTTGGVLSVLFLIEGPFYFLSWHFEVSRTEKVQENLCSSVFSFGFLRKRFSKFSGWLETSDKHWLHSCSILFIHAILVGVPSEQSAFETPCEWFFVFVWEILPVNLKKITKLRFRVLVLSIIINRQTHELGQANKWDHTFFNRWLADERPLCLTKAFCCVSSMNRFRFFSEKNLRRKGRLEWSYKRRT